MAFDFGQFLFVSSAVKQFGFGDMTLTAILADPMVLRVWMIAGLPL